MMTAANKPTLRELVEDFLFKEAALLDEWRLDDWVSLFTEDGRYVVPTTDLPEGDPQRDLVFIDDDITRLRARAVRLNSRHAHREYPWSRTRRFVSNVRVEETSDCELSVASNVLVYRFRNGEGAPYVGSIDYILQRAQFNFKGVLNMPVDEWRRQTDIILTGAFLFTKHVAHLMVRQNRKGNIINIISTAGHQGEPGNVGYGTAKAGLMNFTRSVAMELSQYGIRVNSLTPTATDSSEGRERAARWGVDWPGPRLGQRAAGLLPDASRGAPLLKLPKPSHYGKAAVFLASDDAEMITGFDLRVDAGAVSRYWIWSPGDA